MDPTVSQYMVAAAAALSVGMAKTGLAGLSILAVPFMAEAFGARTSVGIMLHILISADIFAVTFYRRHAQWKIIAALMPATLIGIVCGYFLLGRISNEMLKVTMGALVLALLGVRYATRKVDVATMPGSRFLAPVLGLIAGVTTTMANAAGPLMTVYLLWMRVKKEQFIGTAAWFFFVVNCIKVPFLIRLGLITKETFLFDLRMVPFAVGGAFAGVWLVKKVNQKWFEIAVQVLAVAAGLKLLLG